MALEAQVRALASQGAGVEEICEQLQLEADTVRYIVAQSSEDFSEDDARQMANIIRAVAINGENERNRLQAAQFAYEVKRGLRVSKSAAPVINIVQLNNAIRASQSEVEAFKSGGNGGPNPPDLVRAGTVVTITQEAETQ